MVPLEREVMRRGIYNLPDKDEDIARATIVELSPYKVRLENILCETDIKEQGHLLHSLWTVHRVWHRLT